MAFKIKKGMTLLELMLGLAISVLVFQLIFLTYTTLTKVWQIDFVQSKRLNEIINFTQTLESEIKDAKNFEIASCEPQSLHLVDVSNGWTVEYFNENEHVVKKIGPTKLISLSVSANIDFACALSPQEISGFLNINDFRYPFAAQKVE
jgi:prepilin-type N-terminal cleavage/methylation domain-containing protein